MITALFILALLFLFFGVLIVVWGNISHRVPLVFLLTFAAVGAAAAILNIHQFAVS